MCCSLVSISNGPKSLLGTRNDLIVLNRGRDLKFTVAAPRLASRIGDWCIEFSIQE